MSGKEKPATMEEKRRFFGMLEHYRRVKGYAEGWTAHKHKAKWGAWPKGLKGAGPIEPDQAFKNWMTYQNIKYHKGRQKAEEA